MKSLPRPQSCSRQASTVGALLCFLLFANLLSAQDGYWWTNNRNRNPTKGGWVSNGAFVEEAVFIAPSARVEGSATVTGNARIYGSAVVRGQATVDSKARVYGNAVIEGNAIVGDDAQVFDHARIGGEAFVGGTARVGGYARLNDGQVTDGFMRPPQPAAEVAAAQRAQQEAARAQAAANAHASLISDLDNCIHTLNGGMRHTFSYNGSTTNYQPNISRRGDNLVFATVEIGEGKNEMGRWGRQFRETHRATVPIAQLRVGLPEADRTSRFDKTAPNFYVMTIGLPENSVAMALERSSGTERKSQSSIELLHKSKAALETFRQTITALQHP